jgi:hypothetical protein
VRVNSDKQTLILAGEAIPRRDAVRSSAGDLGLSDMGPRLTIVATRADNTLLLPHGALTRKASTAADDSTSAGMTLSTGGQNKLERSGSLSSARGPSFRAANEYARTQDFWGPGTRSTIIDTYA